VGWDFFKSKVRTDIGGALNSGLLQSGMIFFNSYKSCADVRSLPCFYGIETKSIKA